MPSTIEVRPKRRVPGSLPLIGLMLMEALWASPGVSAEHRIPGAAAVTPTRIVDVVYGHIHPALTLTHDGQLLAAFVTSGQGGKELLLCRSTDAGHTWTPPVAITGPEDDNIYTGSLTTLRDGRILANWSCYKPETRPGQKYDKYREARYSISRDEGRTWTRARSYPVENLTLYTCLRNPIVELDGGRWLLTFFDRTAAFDPARNTLHSWGDGRKHGMVPIVRTPRGTFISGTSDADSPVLGGKVKDPVGGLRSTDGGKTWQPLHALPRLGVSGHDIIVLRDGSLLLTTPEYRESDGWEIGIRMILSTDDGQTWPEKQSLTIHSAGRRIMGRGWPRTVQIDDTTLGTVFFDLEKTMPGGPGLFFIRTPLAALPRISAKR